MEASDLSITDEYLKSSRVSIRRSKTKHIKRLTRTRGTENSSLLSYFCDNPSLSSDVSVILPSRKHNKVDHLKSTFVLKPKPSHSSQQIRTARKEPKETKPRVVLNRKGLEIRELPINKNLLEVLVRQNQCPLVVSVRRRIPDRESNSYKVNKELFEIQNPHSSGTNYIYINEEEEIETCKRTDCIKKSKKKYSAPSNKNLNLSNNNKRDSLTSKLVPPFKEKCDSEQVPLKASFISSLRNYKDKIISATKTDSSCKLREPKKKITTRFTIKPLKSPEELDKGYAQEEKRKQSLTSVSKSKRHFREKELFAKEDKVFAQRSGLRPNGYITPATNKNYKLKENKPFCDVQNKKLSDQFSSETLMKSAQYKKKDIHYVEILPNSFEKKLNKSPLRKELKIKDKVILNASKKSFCKLSEFLQKNDINNNKNVSSILLISEFLPKKDVSSLQPNNEYYFSESDIEVESSNSNVIKNKGYRPFQNNNIFLASNTSNEVKEVNDKSKYYLRKTKSKKSQDQFSFIERIELTETSNKSRNKHIVKNRLNYDPSTVDSFEYDLIPHKENPLTIQSEFINSLNNFEQTTHFVDKHYDSESLDKLSSLKQVHTNKTRVQFDPQELNKLQDSVSKIDYASTNFSSTDNDNYLERNINYSNKTIAKDRNQKLNDTSETEMRVHNDESKQNNFQHPNLQSDNNNVYELVIDKSRNQNDHETKINALGIFNEKEIQNSNIKERTVSFKDINKTNSTLLLKNTLNDSSVSEEFIKMHEYNSKHKSYLESKSRTSHLVNVSTSVMLTRNDCEDDKKLKTPRLVRSVSAFVQTDFNNVLPEIYTNNQNQLQKNKLKNETENKESYITNFTTARMINNSNKVTLVENEFKAVKNSSPIVSDPSQFFGKNPIVSDLSQFYLDKKNKEEVFPLTLKEPQERNSYPKKSQDEVWITQILPGISKREEPIYNNEFQQSGKFSSKSNISTVNLTEKQQVPEILSNDSVQFKHSEQSLLFNSESDKSVKSQVPCVSNSEEINPLKSTTSFITKSRDKSFQPMKDNDSVKCSKRISDSEFNTEQHRTFFKSKNIFMSELPSETTLLLAESTNSSLVMSFKYSSLQSKHPSSATLNNRDDENGSENTTLNWVLQSGSHKPSSIASDQLQLQRSIEIEDLKSLRGEQSQTNFLGKSLFTPKEKHKIFISNIKTPQQNYEVNKITPTWVKSLQPSQECLLEEKAVIPKIKYNLQRKDSIDSRTSGAYNYLLEYKKYICKEDRLNEEREVLPVAHAFSYSIDDPSVEENRNIKTNSEIAWDMTNDDQSFQGNSLKSTSSTLHSFSHILFNISVKDKGTNEAIRSDSNNKTSLRTSLILLPDECFNNKNNVINNTKLEQMRESSDFKKSLDSKRVVGDSEPLKNKCVESVKDKAKNININFANDNSSKDFENKDANKRLLSLLNEEVLDKLETQNSPVENKKTDPNKEKKPLHLVGKETPNAIEEGKKTKHSKENSITKSNKRDKKTNKWTKMLKRKRSFGKINKLFMSGYEFNQIIL